MQGSGEQEAGRASDLKDMATPLATVAGVAYGVGFLIASSYLGSWSITNTTLASLVLKCMNWVERTLDRDKGISPLSRPMSMIEAFLL